MDTHILSHKCQTSASEEKAQQSETVIKGDGVKVLLVHVWGEKVWAKRPSLSTGVMAADGIDAFKRHCLAFQIGPGNV